MKDSTKGTIFGLSMLALLIGTTFAAVWSAAERRSTSDGWQEVRSEIDREVVPAVTSEIDRKHFDDAKCVAVDELVLELIPNKTYTAVIYCESRWSHYHSKIDITRFGSGELYWESNGIQLSPKDIE